MSLQYLSDTQGRHTAVVIAIEDWNQITQTYKGLKALELEKSQQSQIEETPKKPSYFRGSVSKQTAEALLLYTQKARTEWESHTF